MQHTDPETRFDVNARLDVEALTELFDNEQYSSVGAIGRLVYELMLELVLSPSLALELTNIVKDRSFRRAHMWPLDGKEASRDILKDAREVAIEAIIKLTSVDIQIIPDSENAFWAEAIASAGLNDTEKRVTLLFTNLIDTEAIANGLRMSNAAVEKVKNSASEKIQSFLLNKISTGGN